MQLDTKIFVTGAKGFLGKHVVNNLLEKNYNVILPKERIDLTDKSQVQSFFLQNKIDVCIHLAALCGGIQFNSKYPAQIFHNNCLMDLNIIDACNTFKVEKFVALGSICEYADDCPIPFKEGDFLKGIPTNSNRSYGMAKRIMYEQCWAYNTQYGFNFIHPLLINMFGEGDSFDDNRSHVISAIIKRIHLAKLNNDKELSVWGSGNAFRSFLYVKDVADCIVHLMENYNSIEPINLGMDFMINIRDLVVMICEIMDYDGKLVFDSSKPDGQMKRQLDITILNETGWKPKYTFREGLINTISWYQENYGK
jgi:GDP-L-fucose synthase